MITDQGHWSLGVLIGLPILAIFILGGIAILLGGIFSTDYDLKNFGIAGGTVTLVTSIIIGVLSYFPFHAEYHKYYTVKGTVASTSTRLLTDSDHNVSQRVVFRFAESKTLYGCDDTRCTIAKNGDAIQLKCKKDYQWQSVSGWVCRYDQEG